MQPITTQPVSVSVLAFDCGSDCGSECRSDAAPVLDTIMLLNQPISSYSRYHLLAVLQQQGHTVECFAHLVFWLDRQLCLVLSPTGARAVQSVIALPRRLSQFDEGAAV